MFKSFPLLAILCLFLCVIIPSAHAGTFSQEGDLIGQPTQFTVPKTMALSAVARQFDVGLIELKAANPEVTSRPKKGTVLTIPTQHILPNATREGIVVNLAELRLYDFTVADHISTMPITVGSEGWDTPLGETAITAKRKNPTWTPPASIRAQNPNLKSVYPAGPKNPLGLFAMNLGWPGYLIHGTNSPSTIGEWSSHGCIRLYPEDIKALFLATPVGTKVTIIEARYKLGWHSNDLLIEINPVAAVKGKPVPNLTIEEVTPVIMNYVATRAIIIDETALNLALTQNSGIPTVIAKAKLP